MKGDEQTYVSPNRNQHVIILCESSNAVVVVRAASFVDGPTAF